MVCGASGIAVAKSQPSPLHRIRLVASCVLRWAEPSGKLSCPASTKNKRSFRVGTDGESMHARAVGDVDRSGSRPHRTPSASHRHAGMEPANILFAQSHSPRVPALQSLRNARVVGVRLVAAAHRGHGIRELGFPYSRASINPVVEVQKPLTHCLTGATTRQVHGPQLGIGLDYGESIWYLELTWTVHMRLVLLGGTRTSGIWNRPARHCPPAQSSLFSVGFKEARRLPCLVCGSGAQGSPSSQLV